MANNNRLNETHPLSIPVYNPEASNLEDVMMRTNNLGIHDPAFTSSWIDPSIMEKKGIIVQFLSTTVTGHTSAIGVLRLAFDDIRRVPAYLEKYEQNFRVYAYQMLWDHIRRTRNGTCAVEEVVADDIGLSFNVSSINVRSPLFNPIKRADAHLAFCMMPGFLEPCFVQDLGDGRGEYSHLITCNVTLLPANLRGPAIIKNKEKMDEEKAARAAQPEFKPSSSFEGPESKKRKGDYNPNYGRQRYLESQNRDYERDNKEFQKIINEQAARLALLEARLISDPPLPKSKGPEMPPKWPRNGLPIMPDE